MAAGPNQSTAVTPEHETPIKTSAEVVGFYERAALAPPKHCPLPAIHHLPAYKPVYNTLHSGEL